MYNIGDMINDPTPLAIIILIFFIYITSKLNQSIEIDEVSIKTPNITNAINKTKDVLNYMVKHYPFPDDLTITRTTQLIYLIDWEMAKKYHRQITDSKWYLDGSNVQSLNIAEEINDNENITIIKQSSNFGTIKFILQVKNTKESLNYNSLTNEEIEVIDRIIEETKMKTWLDFRGYVISTEPITDGIKYDYLDLNSFVEQEGND